MLILWRLKFSNKWGLNSKATFMLWKCVMISFIFRPSNNLYDLRTCCYWFFKQLDLIGISCKIKQTVVSYFNSNDILFNRYIYIEEVTYLNRFYDEFFYQKGWALFSGWIYDESYLEIWSGINLKHCTFMLKQNFLGLEKRREIVLFKPLRNCKRCNKENSMLKSNSSKIKLCGGV